MGISRSAETSDARTEMGDARRRFKTERRTLTSHTATSGLRSPLPGLWGTARAEGRGGAAWGWGLHGARPVGDGAWGEVRPAQGAARGQKDAVGAAGRGGAGAGPGPGGSSTYRTRCFFRV